MLYFAEAVKINRMETKLPTIGAKMSETKRTRKDVDNDYTQAALLLGHKYRVLHQIKSDAERVEKEIASHLATLLELNKEGMALPPEAVEAKAEEAQA
jgi:chromosome segregation ATPase